MSFRIFAGSLMIAALGLAAPANAADINYMELFRQNAVKCIHRTINLDKVNIEIIKGPDVAGEITTVRFKTYYDGLMKKNVMETEMMIRQAGSIRQMKINQLSDTGTSLGGCELEKNWHDF